MCCASVLAEALVLAEPCLLMLKCIPVLPVGLQVCQSESESVTHCQHSFIYWNQSAAELIVEVYFHRYLKMVRYLN